MQVRSCGPICIGGNTCRKVWTPHEKLKKHVCVGCEGEGIKRYIHPFDPEVKIEKCRVCHGDGVVWG